MLKISLILLLKVKVKNNKLKKKILIFSAFEAIRPSTINVLRFVFYIIEIVKIINPKILITTFEGHAWERILFANVHQHDQNIICSGYTHAPIFRYQHAIRSISKISIQIFYLQQVKFKNINSEIVM